jgi:hypothetical protein
VRALRRHERACPPSDAGLARSSARATLFLATAERLHLTDVVPPRRVRRVPVGVPRLPRADRACDAGSAHRASIDVEPPRSSRAVDAYEQHRPLRRGVPRRGCRGHPELAIASSSTGRSTASRP